VIYLFFLSKIKYINKKEIQKLRGINLTQQPHNQPKKGITTVIKQKWYKNKCFTDKYTSIKSSEPNVGNGTELQKKATCKRLQAYPCQTIDEYENNSNSSFFVAHELPPTRTDSLTTNPSK